MSIVPALGKQEDYELEASLGQKAGFKREGWVVYNKDINFKYVKVFLKILV